MHGEKFIPAKWPHQMHRLVKVSVWCAHKWFHSRLFHSRKSRMYQVRILTKSASLSSTQLLSPRSPIRPFPASRIPNIGTSLVLTLLCTRLAPCAKVGWLLNSPVSSLVGSLLNCMFDLSCKNCLTGWLVGWLVGSSDKSVQVSPSMFLHSGSEMQCRSPHPASNTPKSGLGFRI